VTVKHSGMAAWIEEKRVAAVEAGRVCKNCGEAIDSQVRGGGYFHVVSFMTLCGGSRGTYAELKVDE
jgi:hypothetical protein